MGRARPFLILGAVVLMAGLVVIAGTGALRGRQAGTGVQSAASQPEAAGAATSPGPPAVRLRQVAGAFPGALYVTAPPGDRTRLFVVEQGGRVMIVRHGATLQRPFLDISSMVSTGGERGLLGLAFDPGYPTNGFFYVDYTDRAGDTRVVRYRVSATDPNAADPASATVILRVAQPYPNHNGGQLAFGPNGSLYVGLGDGGSAGDPGDRAQSSATLLGKIVRISSPATTASAGIHALGLRNPWRFSFDRTTGALWIGDVGQDQWEEIDYLRPGHPAGANLGWSAYEGSHVFKPQVAASLDKAALVWPVAQYSHRLGSAVVGGYVFRGPAPRALRGWYLFADNASARVWAMFGPRGKVFSLRGADRVLPGITSFGEDARGRLYLTSTAGKVYLIAPQP